MKNKIREHENRYWLINDDVYELHFTQFYDDEIILKFVQDKDNSENYINENKDGTDFMRGMEKAYDMIER